MANTLLRSLLFNKNTNPLLNISAAAPYTTPPENVQTLLHHLLIINL